MKESQIQTHYFFGSNLLGDRVPIAFKVRLTPGGAVIYKEPGFRQSPGFHSRFTVADLSLYPRTAKGCVALEMQRLSARVRSLENSLKTTREELDWATNMHARLVADEFKGVVKDS